ncbi:MAG: glycosyltransferase family 4 protein, partial [Patescibacteria group bacterium]
ALKHIKIVRSRPLIPGGAAGWVPAWRKQLAGFDLIHLHYPFYGGAESVWLNSGKVPYIITYHMDAQPTALFKKPIKLIYDRFLAPYIIRGARRVILVDDNHSFSLDKKISSSQKVLLPNGIDIGIFSPGVVSPNEFGLDKLVGKDLFLFVGNFLSVKGLPLLIKAWNKLSDNQAHLLVVGGGHSESSYKKLAEKFGVADRIHWQGPCYDKNRLAKYYRLAAAVIIPSFSESFSLVAGEALASGCPVIASDVPGIRGRVKDGKTGFLFESGAERGLIDALEKFMRLSTAERAGLGSAGRELIVKEFSLKKHTDLLEEVYSGSV